MPLTPSQRQARMRAKRLALIARYEAALREIGTGYYGNTAHIIANAALTPDKETQG